MRTSEIRAIEAVVDLFEGQPRIETGMTLEESVASSNTCATRPISLTAVIWPSSVTAMPALSYPRCCRA